MKGLSGDCGKPEVGADRSVQAASALGACNRVADIFAVKGGVLANGTGRSWYGSQMAIRLGTGAGKNDRKDDRAAARGSRAIGLRFWDAVWCHS